MKVKPIKAWAVIDKEGISTLIMDSPFVSQPYAIYPLKTGERAMWNKKLLKKFKAKVVQVTITLSPK
jgi:hypothetical protein